MERFIFRNDGIDCFASLAMTKKLMKILGIDYGDSKVGIAIGDTESGMALPYKIIKNSGWNNLIADLEKIIKNESVGKIVIGLPIDANGNNSAQTLRVKEFVKEFEKKVKIEIDFCDERFSTQEAQRFTKSKNEDDIAASIILQSYLDKIN